jgi:hypothetical protein
MTATAKDKQEFWFCFFSSRQFVAEEKLTPPAAEEKARFLAKHYTERIECFQGKSEQLDGDERPYCVKFPSAGF